MSKITHQYAGADWPSEAQRGRPIKPGDRDAIRDFYPRLHSWERVQGTDIERARLNEARALRDSLDYIGEMMERLTSRLAREEHRSERFYKAFDRTLDVLQQNAAAQDPVPLNKLLDEVGKITGASKSLRIFQAINDGGIKGATDKEGAAITRIDIDSYRTMRGRLKKNGSVVDSGFKRATVGGKPQTVWVSKHNYRKLQLIQIEVEHSNACGVAQT